MGTPQGFQPSAEVSHSSQTWCSRLELGWQVQLMSLNASGPIKTRNKLLRSKQ